MGWRKPAHRLSQRVSTKKRRSPVRHFYINAQGSHGQSSLTTPSNLPPGHHSKKEAAPIGKQLLKLIKCSRTSLRCSAPAPMPDLILVTPDTEEFGRVFGSLARKMVISWNRGSRGTTRMDWQGAVSVRLATTNFNLWKGPRGRRCTLQGNALRTAHARASTCDSDSYLLAAIRG